jgi:hypothetical protein
MAALHSQIQVLVVAEVAETIISQVILAKVELQADI